MVYAARIGEKLGVSPAGLTEDTKSLLEQNRLPVETEGKILHKALELLLADKKAEGRKLNFILIDEIGHAVIQKLDVEEIQKILKE